MEALQATLGKPGWGKLSLPTLGWPVQQIKTQTPSYIQISHKQ